MNRRSFGRALVALGSLVGISEAEAARSDATHRVVFQIDSDDRRTQLVALRNAMNYAAFYRKNNEQYALAIVVFGPGFDMVRNDISMMKGQIETMQKELGSSLAILACHNTREAIAESMGKKADDIPLLPGVTETPSGVVAIAERQEKGWAYIRP